MGVVYVLIVLIPAAFTSLNNRNQSLWLEDDVINEEPHLLDRRMASMKTKWPEGVVPYTVGPGLESIHKFIKKAAKEFAQKTCIHFVPKKDQHEHYVEFIRDDDQCGLATVCKAGGVQNVWIGKNCLDYDTVVHELGHAICMSHEHQRPDRDEYISLSCKQNYSKKNMSSYSTLGLMYDYMSVMHYQFCNGSCMKPKLPGVTNCGGLELSVLDAEKINSLYECGGCHGYRFRPHNSNSFIFAAGIDTDRAELGVCRAYVQGDIAVGKQTKSDQGTVCSIPYGGLEHVISKYFEVMTKVNKKLFGWYDMRKGQAVPYGAIPGGRDKHGEPLYIGRCNAKHDGKKAMVPGKIHQRRMYYAYRGKEHECNKFQVLYCLGK